jgi:hypothetical protein
MNMEKNLRIYLDATIFRGCDDPEYEKWSWSLLQDCHEGLYKPVISTLVEKELEGESKATLDAFAELLTCKPRIITPSERAETLADLYVERKIVLPDFRPAALHVALATLEEVDVLTSWDYTNILHLFRVRKYVTVNLELGLKPIQIRSPRVLASYELKQTQTPLKLASG